MNKEKRDVNVAIIGLVLLILAAASTVIASISVPRAAIIAFLFKSVLLGMAIGCIARESDELSEGTKVTLGFFVGYGGLFLALSTIIVTGLLVPLTIFVFALGFTFFYSGAPHHIMDPDDFIIIFGILAVVVFMVSFVIDQILSWTTSVAIPYLIANPLVIFLIIGGLILIIASIRHED